MNLFGCLVKMFYSEHGLIPLFLYNKFWMVKFIVFILRSRGYEFALPNSAGTNVMPWNVASCLGLHFQTNKFTNFQFITKL